MQPPFMPQSDWVEWAEELGLQPSLEAIKAIKAGETDEDKALRHKRQQAPSEPSAL